MIVKFSNQKINGTRVVRLNRHFSKSQLSSQVGRTEQKAKEKIIADGTAEIKKVKRKNLKRKTLEFVSKGRSVLLPQLDFFKLPFLRKQTNKQIKKKQTSQQEKKKERSVEQKKVIQTTRK